MEARLVLLIAFLATLATSCVTQKLWKATDPNARVPISADQVSEAPLRESGIPYRQDRFGTYYIEKTRSERLGDHALRAVFAPAAVCIDAMPYLALLSAQVFLGYPMVELDEQNAPKLILPSSLTSHP